MQRMSPRLLDHFSSRTADKDHESTAELVEGHQLEELGRIHVVWELCCLVFEIVAPVGFPVGDCGNSVVLRSCYVGEPWKLIFYINLNKFCYLFLNLYLKNVVLLRLLHKPFFPFKSFRFIFIWVNHLNIIIFNSFFNFKNLNKINIIFGIK